MDESKQFHEWFNSYETPPVLFVPDAMGRTITVDLSQQLKDAFHAGAESQRQVGPCGKHPVACWVPVDVAITFAGPKHPTPAMHCRWCASEQALRAEIATLKSTIKELDRWRGADTERIKTMVDQAAERDEEIANLKSEVHGLGCVVAARNATIAELGADRDHSDSCLCETANKLLEVNRNLATREAELTTLRDKLRGLLVHVSKLTEYYQWRNGPGSCYPGARQSLILRHEVTDFINALLAEEAGR